MAREDGVVDIAPGSWRRLQREAGEEPETDEAVALARLQEILGATISEGDDRAS